MSRRLTKALKDAIKEKAISKAFNEQYIALNTEKTELVERLYQEHYGQHLELMRSFPRGYFSYYQEFTLSIRNTDYGWKHLTKCEFINPMPFPFYHTEFTQIQCDEPLYEDAREILLKLEKLDDDKSKFNIDCSALLSSVYTVEKLLEVWPEIHEFIPAEEKKSLPIPFDLTINLNKRLGLSGGAA